MPNMHETKNWEKRMQTCNHAKISSPLLAPLSSWGVRECSGCLGVCLKAGLTAGQS